jgi:hypothetical protein
VFVVIDIGATKVGYLLKRSFTHCVLRRLKQRYCHCCAKATATMLEIEDGIFEVVASVDESSRQLVRSAMAGRIDLICTGYAISSMISLQTPQSAHSAAMRSMSGS